MIKKPIPLYLYVKGYKNVNKGFLPYMSNKKGASLPANTKVEYQQRI